MKLKLLFLLLIILVSCTDDKQTNKLRVGESNRKIVIASKIDVGNDFFISLYSFIQANNSGLYITPSNTINDTVLYQLKSDRVGRCCQKLEGKVREGKGPKEITQIFASSKTVHSDTLLFYSPNSARYLAINNEGDLIEDFSLKTPKDVINTGNSFAYSNGYFLIPSFSVGYKTESLLTLVNFNNGKRKDFFTPRVPLGFEPAIRNEIVAMAALPNGFALSFVGDRKVYLIDLNGEIKKQLIFGKSEPIPEPYKVKDPKQGPSSKPYIIKIEYYKGNLLVLADNLIWILEFPSYQTQAVLKILRDPEEQSAPLIDFSVSEEVFYLRMGRDGLYYVKVNNNWFK